MKKQILFFIILYLIVLSIILYGFLYEHVEVLIPSLLILVILLILGFIFNSYVLKQKYEIDDNVLHLTKEILHELAIPISTIQANSLLLKRTLKDDAKSMKRLGRIEDSSARLEKLYEELLYSIKKEIKTVEREEFDLRLLVEERVETMKMLQRNPFELDVESCKVFVDKIGFEKMFDNILTNAMKYSDKKNMISISLNNKILEVRDRGIGMDSKELEHVYQRYYQSDKGVSGNGIGLALVKAYCKDEMITISIHSEKEKGTRVHLNLKKIVV